ncbi:hypothetical protein B296_00052535, partial [Ensete ventricosum]
YLLSHPKDLSSETLKSSLSSWKTKRSLGKKQKMKITVMTPDDRFITLDVDPDESVRSVCFEALFFCNALSEMTVKIQSLLLNFVIGFDLLSCRLRMLKRCLRWRYVCFESVSLALMYADPFDVEAQKKIEASIRQVL